MSRYIVFERTGEARTPKSGELFETSYHGLPAFAAEDFLTDKHPILRRLPDAEVRRLRVSLEVAGTGYRDALAENERLKAQLDGRYDADTRARFERETASRRYDYALANCPLKFADLDAQGLTLERWAAREAIREARVLADEVFGPAAGKGEDAATPAPTKELWVPQKGDEVRCTKIGVVDCLTGDECFAVEFDEFIVDLEPKDMELVRRAEDAKS